MLKVITSILFSCLFFTAAAAENRDKVFKIGIIAPLSGEVAPWGVSLKNGALLAHQELSTEDQASIKLYIEDDAFDPKQAISAFTRLAEVEGVNAIINAGSPGAKVIAPLAEQKKIPFISSSTDPNSFKGRNYVVGLWVTPEAESQAILEESIRRGYKKIARISAFHEFGLSTALAFDKLNQGRITISYDEQFSPETRDFKAVATKLKRQKNLDAVVISLLPGQTSAFARQLRDLGITTPLVGYEMFEDEAEVKASNGALIGQWFTNSGNPSSDFLVRYKTKFGDAPYVESANGYDAVKLFVLAYKQDPTPEGIMRFLHTLKDYQGELGKYSASGDNRFTLPAAVKIVTPTGFEQLRQ